MVILFFKTANDFQIDFYALCPYSGLYYLLLSDIAWLHGNILSTAIGKDVS